MFIKAKKTDKKNPIERIKKIMTEEKEVLPSLKNQEKVIKQETERVDRSFLKISERITSLNRKI